MQDAADAMIWETFHHPGATGQAMLPPQPSRNVSLGQPLQLMDSNQTAPYVEKGKGRVRDSDPAQQIPSIWQGFVPQQQPSIGGFESSNYQPMGFDGMPFPNTEGLHGSINNFGFIQDQMQFWQPVQPNYFQPGIMDPTCQEFQTSQAQAHPHAHPPPVQQVQVGPAPRSPPQQQTVPQMLLQYPFQPPPGFPQQPQMPEQTFQQAPQLEQSAPPAPPPTAPQPAQSESTTAEENPQPSGYRYRPGVGFVCRVCGYHMRQPGLHRFLGQNIWCWADGPGMQEEAGLEADRRRNQQARARAAKKGKGEKQVGIKMRFI